MTTSVGMKAQKKQSSKHDKSSQDLLPAPVYDPVLERALLGLESVCVRILDERGDESDPDRMYWRQRFKNIVTPISLALMEYKGPRRFHYHYRHSASDDSVLEPVLEDAADMLARVCESALVASQKKLAGLHDRDLIRSQQQLESALRTFLLRHQRNVAQQEAVQ